MKKFKYIIFLLFLFMTTDIVNAYSIYQLDDFVYFDPVSDSVCNETNYWTVYKQDTTCYRFIVLEKNDVATSKTLKVMLDHNIGYDTYDNYKKVLESNTANWNRYKGNIDIIDENTIYDVLNLKDKPTLDNISVNGGTIFPYFAINSSYVINGNTFNYYGFWSKDLYPDDKNYVYTVTEFGNNRLVSKNNKRGIRPVITIDKAQLTYSSNLKDISSLIKGAKEYKYKNSTDLYDGKIYKQLQGFTLTKDKLVFHSSNNSNPDYGLLDSYSGVGYETLYKRTYADTGHGNDMTYNSKTNKVLMVGPTSYNEIYEYNGDTLEYQKKYTATDLGNNVYVAIGYDAKNDYYLALGSSRRVYILNNRFKQLYSFDVPVSGVYQGMEYYNGYLYLTTFESSCPNTYQTYCLYKPWSSITYVYNVKFNSNGSPNDNFGRLVQRLYIGDGIGELESVAFHNNEIYFGYAAAHLDSNYAYKFYSFPYKKIAYNPDYTVSYIDGDNKKTIKISSSEELQGISGWTLSNDLHTLSKQVVNDTSATSISVCDLYRNCSSVSLKEITFTDDDNKDSDFGDSGDKDVIVVPPSDVEDNTNNNDDTDLDNSDNKDVIVVPPSDTVDNNNVSDSGVNNSNEEDILVENPSTAIKKYSLMLLYVLFAFTAYIYVIYNKTGMKKL